MSALVSIIIGDRRYLDTGREAVRSVLRHTDFDVCVSCDPGFSFPAQRSSRLAVKALAPLPASPHRSLAFLRKFQSLEQAHAESSNDWMIHLDADAIFVARTREADLRDAVRTADFGMVEQTGITGSTMTRASFLDHYILHSLRFIEPTRPPPPLDRFRYYNAGMVIGKRAWWARVLPWAIRAVESEQRDHQVGEHMIADQDYFQYWANSLHPGSCADLPWSWNHCEYWDQPFPRSGARILHFSNFCNGPASGTLQRMRSAQSPWRRFLQRCMSPS